MITMGYPIFRPMRPMPLKNMLCETMALDSQRFSHQEWTVTERQKRSENEQNIRRPTTNAGGECLQNMGIWYKDLDFDVGKKKRKKNNSSSHSVN